MANLQTETIQLRVLIDGTPARKELAQLDQEFAKINADLRGVKKGTEEWVKGSARMDEITKRQTELRKEIGLTGLTAKQMGDELRRLQIAQRNLTPNTQQWAENQVRIKALKDRLRELNDTVAQSAAVWEVQRKNMRLADMSMEQLEAESRRLRMAIHSINPNTAQFATLSRELKNVDARMTTLRQGMSGFSRMWTEVKTNMVSAGAVLAGMFAGTMISTWISGMVKGSAELSDLQADVRRTTGMTKSEVDELTKSLGQMNTRTARAELLKLATDAGKLGITGVQDVMKFVRAGDQIRVALGEDLGEDAIKSIGKLNQTFKVGETSGKDLEGQMLATGSAINALGQASTAQEAFLVDFTTRMAGVNTQAGINVQNTLGYAAALDQLGQRSETSSTALSQFTLKAFKDTADYAQIAGMGVQEFSQLLSTDTNEALLRVLEGLNGNNAGLQMMVQKFGMVDQEGARAVGVLSSLANNTKLVREQQALANTEFEKGTSISNEFNTKNSTLGANLEVIGKKLQGWFVNSSFVDGLTRASKGLRDMVSPVISEGLERERIEMQKTYAQILTLNEGSAERTKLIKELQAQYPAYLGSLDADTVSNQRLGKAIRELNQQLVNKIVLQEKDEDIQKQLETQANKQMQVLEMEDDVRERMVKLAEKHNLTLAEGVPILEQARQLYTQIDAERKKTGQTTGGVMFDEVARFGHSIRELGHATSFLNGEQDKSNRLTEEKNELMKRLGITMDEAAAEPPPTAVAAPDAVIGVAVDDAAVAKAKADMERMRLELDAIRESMYQDTLADDERALRQLDVKHAEELAKLKANKLATAADIEAMERQHEQQRLDLTTEQGNKRLAAFAEVDAKITAGLRSANAERLQLELDALDQRIAAVKSAGGDTTGLDAERRTLQLRIYEQNALDALEAEAKKFDDLILLGQANGIDTAQLEEEKGRMLDAIRKKWDGKAVEDTKKTEAQIRAERVKSLQNAAGIMQAFGGVVQSMISYKDAEVSAAEKAADMDGKRTASEISLIKKLERERRSAAMVAIAVQGAVAIAKGIAGAMDLPYPGNLIAAATAVGEVIALIAQAKSMMSSGGSSVNTGQDSQPTVTVDNVPIGEKGLVGEPDGTIKTAKGGVFKGPSHNAGGLGVYDNNTGQQVAEVEGGEPWMVLSKAFREKNSGLIPELLRASAEGSRVDVARVPNVFSPVPAFNAKAASESMNIVHMAQGGVSNGSVYTFSKSTSAASPGGGDGGTPPWAAAMLAELRRVNSEPPTAILKLGPAYDRESGKWTKQKERHTLTRKVA